MTEDHLFTSPSYLDGKSFAAYSAAVLGVIRDAERPVTIREIHDALGDAALKRWTADALDSLYGSVEAVGICPTRYRIKPPRRVTPPTPFGRTFLPERDGADSAFRDPHSAFRDPHLNYGSNYFYYRLRRDRDHRRQISGGPRR